MRKKNGMLLLVQRAQKKDDRAFVELITQSEPDLYKVARGYLSSREDIADAIQDTVVTVYEKLETLKQPEYFKTWMIRILIRKCTDILRRGKREYPAETVPEQEDSGLPFQNYEFEELMNQLDDKYRIVLLLYYAEGFRVSEIAQILDIEENTVRTRISRGRERFKQMYTAEVM